MEFSFEELVSALEGEVVINNDYKKFKCTCIDNRKVTEDCIFFAIKGEKFNANNDTNEIPIIAHHIRSNGDFICVIVIYKVF